METWKSVWVEWAEEAGWLEWGTALAYVAEEAVHCRIFFIRFVSFSVSNECRANQAHLSTPIPPSAGDGTIAIGANFLETFRNNFCREDDEWADLQSESHGFLRVKRECDSSFGPPRDFPVSS